MLNNKILIAIIVVVLLGIGGYFILNAQKGASQQGKGHTMQDMNGKPIAESQRNYEIDVTSNTTNVKPGGKITIAYKIKNDTGEVVKSYDTVHEKIMHFITIRKDLAYFQHLHPTYNETTGEFTVDVTFPEDGSYRIFPDFTPSVDNPQKLPVTVFKDIDVGDIKKYYPQRVVPDSETKKTYGDYQVTTTFPKDTKKQTEVTFAIDIAKDGKPVTNLEQYLGALGHSVILKEGTLDFIHTHALEATGNTMTEGHAMQGSGQDSGVSEMGPKINFSTSFPESGIYRIFTQFQHQGEIQTVNYTVTVN